MDRAQLIAKLKSIEPRMRDHGIAGLYLFGSYARGEAKEESDVDVFVDKAPNRKFGFDELMGGYEAIAEALPDVEVNYGTREGLSKYIRSEVERQAVRIF